MKPIKFLAVLLLIVLLSPLSSYTAEASVFERIKEIYHTPEKLEEMEKHYAESRQKLEQQLELQNQQLAQSRKQIEAMLLEQQELMGINSRYQLENKALQEQNKRLQQHLEQTELSRSTTIRKIVTTVSTGVLLLLIYALSIRIWRYMAWRKQKIQSQESLTP